MTTLNTEQFTEFKRKRDAWMEWLSGGDIHSIKNQIIWMIWDAGVFRVINEARRLAPTDDSGEVQLNGIEHDLINRGFMVSQASAIRRLVDRGPAQGPRGVYSLYGLLDDMEKHAHLMTREHIFAAENLEYDYESVRAAYIEYCHQKARTADGPFGIPPNLRWEGPADRHEEIDRLSGETRDRRSPRDAVRPDCFCRLKKRLEVCDGIKDYVDKFIAHAATPWSRAAVDPENLRVLLDRLLERFWDAHEAISRVANLVSIRLLGGSNVGGLMTPQFDQFRHMDKALVNSDNVPHLRELWRQYERDTREWSSVGIEELAP